ncbi:MAG: shikimate dehydrogenase, partial [Chloroflexi bacterium]
MIDSGTSLYCVIGDPVSHSLSPAMHNKAFIHTGFNGVYVAFNVNNISYAVKGIRGLGIKGASITIPHKIEVMKYLDGIDSKAREIGAVNTIVNRNGKLYGYNTDCLGAINALLEKTEIKNKQIVIAGAGGAARAIGFGILSEGGNLTIINILEDEGKSLAKDLDVPYYPLSYFKNLDCDILINATPVGMTPYVEAMPVKSEDLHKEMTVMDIVYNPLQTRLLREAQNLGCLTINGVSMFVHQGVAQFELWTGLGAPVDIMTQAV